MKTTDLWQGAEVAVKWWGYEVKAGWRRARIEKVSTGRGIPHKVSELYRETGQPTGATGSLPSKRIMMLWSEFVPVQEAMAADKEVAEVRQSLLSSLREGQIDRVSTFIAQLELLGIEATAYTSRHNPTDPDSSCQALRVEDSIKLLDLIEPVIAAAIVSKFSATPPEVLDSDNAVGVHSGIA